MRNELIGSEKNEPVKPSVSSDTVIQGISANQKKYNWRGRCCKRLCNLNSSQLRTGIGRFACGTACAIAFGAVEYFIIEAIQITTPDYKIAGIFCAAVFAIAAGCCSAKAVSGCCCCKTDSQEQTQTAYVAS